MTPPRSKAIFHAGDGSRFEVKVDLQMIAQELIDRAIANSSGKATAIRGAVVVTRLPPALL